ncbi:hypothetical protein V1508DRAFT_270383 [Lipomyces doorenjongii]|uniref:uncharacterized protein n=1 Tax=Lipomyces doorenjongii TaxID=383834 RepID=UPI0034CDECEC
MIYDCDRRVRFRAVPFPHWYDHNALLNVLTMFQRLLRNCERCICLQHRIPETTVSFYMNAMEISAGTDEDVKRKVSGLVDRPFNDAPPEANHRPKLLKLSRIS